MINSTKLTNFINMMNEKGELIVIDKQDRIILLDRTNKFKKLATLKIKREQNKNIYLTQSIKITPHLKSRINYFEKIIL